MKFLLVVIPPSIYHMTTEPSPITLLSVVSRESVRIGLTIASLNGLDILVCDIYNAYPTAFCRENT